MPDAAYADEISIGAYILERLSQLGVTSLFGVPGKSDGMQLSLLVRNS